MAKEELEAWLTKHDVTVESEFIPFSQSRNAKPRGEDRFVKGLDPQPWKSLNWRVTIKRAGVEIVSTDYSAGVAHTPAYKQPQPHCGSVVREKIADWEIEHGYRGRWTDSQGAQQVHKHYLAKERLRPDNCDVIHSLISDADVLDHNGFADWAHSFGYNADSIKDKAIYEACLEIALKLKNGLGDEAFRELQVAAQDY